MASFGNCEQHGLDFDVFFRLRLTDRLHWSVQGHSCWCCSSGLSWDVRAHQGTAHLWFDFASHWIHRHAYQECLLFRICDAVNKANATHHKKKVETVPPRFWRRAEKQFWKSYEFGSRQPAAAYRGIVLKGLGRSEQMLHLKNVCRHEVRLVTIFCLGGLERPKQLTKNLGKLHVAFCLYSCVEHFVLASWTSKHWGHFQRQQRTEEVCTRLDDRKLASELVNVWLANFGDALYGFACTNQKFPNTSVWTRHSNAAGACGCRFGISNPFDKNSLWTVDTQHFFDLICGDPYQRGSHIKSTQQTGEQASGAPPSLAMTFYSSGPVWLGSTQRDSLLSICLCADRSIDLSFFSNLSIHLPTYLPAYVSILYLSIHRFICLSIYLSIYLSMWVCMYACIVLYCVVLHCLVFVFVLVLVLKLYL